MNNRWLAIKQLDRQLKKWQTVSNEHGSPRAGWVKTLRKTLGLSMEQLANRLGLSPSRISQLEQAEIRDAVTLRALRETANAMECELVYAFVPKGQTSLENILIRNAEKIATEQVASVAHSMSLEAQTVDPAMLDEQKEKLIESLLDGYKNNKSFRHFIKEKKR